MGVVGEFTHTRSATAIGTDAPRDEELIIREARRRRRRRLTLLGAGLVLVGGVFVTGIALVLSSRHQPGPPSSSRASGPTTIPPPAALSLRACSPSQLAVAAGQTIAGAGNRAFVLVFENESSRACSLEGYPTITGLDASGRPVGSSVPTPPNFLGSTPSQEVDLDQGQSASTFVQTLGVQVTPSETCHTWDTALVNLPRSNDHISVPLKWQQPSQAVRGLYVCGNVYADAFEPGVKSLLGGVEQSPQNVPPIPQSGTGQTTTTTNG